MKKSAPTSFEDLSELIVTAIRDEHFFNKEVLIPKVKAIIKGFKIDVASANYNAIESPSESARRLRELEKLEVEKTFWQRKTKELIGDKINDCYKELDEVYQRYGFPNRSLVK